MDEKKISVIMGVYNCEDTVVDAIESILMQTYSNWELIICDDYSTDNTYEILKQYKIEYPNKIVLLNNKINCKLPYTLNKCLKYSSGNYIARMDGDDISCNNRFEKQIGFLESNPETDLVGTSMQRFDGKEVADILYSIQNPDKYTLKKRLPFNHATIMTYKKVYDKLNGYTVSKRTERCEDYDLWFRFFDKGFKGDNLIEPLYYVRENINAIKRRTIKSRFNAYRTTIIGFRLLNYPLHWYIFPTIKMLFKVMVPTKLILIYREYQNIKFSNKNEKI